MRKLIRSFSAAFALLTPCLLHAWDYEGHRTVNLLALEALPPEFPKFVKSAEARERIAFLGGEPDRWRNSLELPFKHATSPDHYIDLEELQPMGTTPEALTEFRNLFVAQLAAARQLHPEHFPSIDPQRNKDHTREIIGTLPWTIAEYYGKLRSEFSYLKELEENGSPEEIANAQANILYVMGVMGHFVGDGSQPLHTTRHNNGWEGENPNGYTTARTFHSWIDGGFIKKTGKLDVVRLATEVKPAKVLSSAPDAAGRNGIFSNVMAYLVEQHAKVVPLYQLDKAGKLSPQNGREGREFLEHQIEVGATMLSSLWLTAWRDAPPDTFLRASLLDAKLKSGAGKQ